MTPKRIPMPSATSIVARSYPDHIIGVDNRLPWHLRTDLKMFKARTSGHAIIMGRRTFESLGRPLPNRLNIVLSREEFPESKNVRWARDVSTALLIADIYAICNMQRQFFVIGGDRIYREFLGLINKIWLTDVFSGRINGDAKFDYEFTPAEWWSPYERDFQPAEGDDFPFRVTCWIRKKPHHRERSVDDFLSVDHDVVSALDDWMETHRAKSEVEIMEEEQLMLFPGRDEKPQP